ncbi:hypothetical protein GEMRC1_010450 [Eukaryota sp. GEM-RC1]
MPPPSCNVLIKGLDEPDDTSSIEKLFGAFAPIYLSASRSLLLTFDNVFDATKAQKHLSAVLSLIKNVSVSFIYNTERQNLLNESISNLSPPPTSQPSFEEPQDDSSLTGLNRTIIQMSITTPTPSSLTTDSILSLVPNRSKVEKLSVSPLSAEVFLQFKSPSDARHFLTDQPNTPTVSCRMIEKPSLNPSSPWFLYTEFNEAPPTDSIRASLSLPPSPIDQFAVHTPNGAAIQRFPSIHQQATPFHGS